jgi:hypothetical protein
MQFDLEPFIENVRQSVKDHAIDPSQGSYRRWLRMNSNPTCHLEDSGYGSADAANILFTIGEFAPTAEQSTVWVEHLQNFQDPETGLFREPCMNNPIHSTAFLAATLELFHAAPQYPLYKLLPYLDTEKLADFLQHLDWAGNPWAQSHHGAGLFAAFANTGIATPAWKRAYFDWLNSHLDPEYPLSPVQAVQSGKAMEAHHLFGWFNYMFNMEYAHKPLKYPERLIDTCIELCDTDTLDKPFGKFIGFREIDWVYALNRAMRQSPHRFYEAKERLRDFAGKFVAYLASLDYETDDRANDLHMLFGTVCALAELQSALPGEVVSTRPLRLVLDRRPFI